VLDRLVESAERDGLAAVRMGDRAARLMIHAGDLTVLVLIVGDDAVEVALLKFCFCAKFILNNGAQLVEQLAGVETVFAVTADLGDHLVEMVEHDIFLRACLRTIVPVPQALFRPARALGFVRIGQVSVFPR